MSNPTAKHGMKWWKVALFIPLLLCFLLLALPLYFIATVCLHIIIWSFWCLRGRDILFVYSDSPIWHDYIEERILPQLGNRVIVLNWSQRKRWRVSLASLPFSHFSGYRQFNPLAVVFRPLRRTRTYRFWQPFRDFKHGRPGPLSRMQSEFFGLIGVQRHELQA